MSVETAALGTETEVSFDGRRSSDVRCRLSMVFVVAIMIKKIFITGTEYESGCNCRRSSVDPCRGHQYRTSHYYRIALYLFI